MFLQFWSGWKRSNFISRALYKIYFIVLRYRFSIFLAGHWISFIVVNDTRYLNMKKNAFLDMRQTHKSIFLSHLYSSTYQIDLCSIHGLLTLLCLERSGTNQFKLLSSNHNTQKSTSTPNLKTFETKMPPLMQICARNKSSYTYTHK